MENILSLEHLWENPTRVEKPPEALSEIRAYILESFLEKSQKSEGNEPNVRDTTDIIDDTISSINELLSQTQHNDNTIISQLHTEGSKFYGDATTFVKATIALWYTNTILILARDPEATRTVESQFFGNLGLMSMVLTAENWKPPKNKRLRAATLIANTSTTMIFAAYLISLKHEEANIGLWRTALKSLPSKVYIRAFLKCSWNIARLGLETSPPGSIVGAHTDEIKLRADAKGILTKVGMESWDEAPYWHPCKRVPGSPWNKFLRNARQPLFSSPPSGDIVHRMPSTAIKLAEPFEKYYTDIRTKIDQTGRERDIVSGEELSQQHGRLACKSGQAYPDDPITEDDADDAYDVQQDYMDSVALGKRPISDFRGHITLPFLTSAARAMRFSEEPDAIEEDLWVLTFGGRDMDVL